MTSAWLDGKVALVTGGGSGIGEAVVTAYAMQGARVAVLERSPEKVRSLRESYGQVVVVEGDATSQDDNERAVRTACAELGPLDVLVTVVGVFDHYTALTDIPDEQFDAAFVEVFDVNVRSAFLAVRAAAGELRRNRGNVILTCSSSSFYAGRGGTLYVAAKHALRGAVVQLAHELAPEVRVNGVAPGGTVGTDLRGARALGMEERRLEDRPGRAEEMRARTPLSVALTGADHAGAYVYLASAQASGVTGELIRSDGGIGIR